MNFISDTSKQADEVIFTQNAQQLRNTSQTVKKHTKVPSFWLWKVITSLFTPVWATGKSINYSNLLINSITLK